MRDEFEKIRTRSYTNRNEYSGEDEDFRDYESNYENDRYPNVDNLSISPPDRLKEKRNQSSETINDDIKHPSGDCSEGSQ